MKDTIYREDAIKAFDTEPFIVGDAKAAINTYSYVYDVIRRIKNLPPAQPERIKGRWIDDGQYAFLHRAWKCTECGKCVIEVGEPWFKFCPNCGADMRGKL